MTTTISCWMLTLLAICHFIRTDALEIGGDGNASVHITNVPEEKFDVLSMEWPHMTFVDHPHNNYQLFWKPRTHDILFRLDVRTRGYVGFGLSKNGRMAGSDILIGWVRDGQPFIQDRHGTSHSEPTVDKKQDWFLLGGSENETHTVLAFKRNYDTCDRHDLKITNDTWRVIYAYHEDDPELSSNNIVYHGRPNRGVKSVLFTQHVSKPEALPSLQKSFSSKEEDEDSILYWDLTSSRVTLPEDDDTLYWCKLFKLPASIKSKHHMIGVGPKGFKSIVYTMRDFDATFQLQNMDWHEPIIQEGNEGFMHHVVIYECESRNSEEEEEFEELIGAEGHLCYEPTIPKALKSCDRMIAVWAIGSQGFFMPDGVGYLLDPESGSKYFKMEIHYDNPYLQDDIKDSSGLRLYYTRKLREVEAGVLSIGIDPNWKHLIPPKQSATVSYGHCIGKCTQKTLPTEGISVFAAVLHSHLIGRKIRLRHIRGETELPPIANDGNYDFEYQEYRMFGIPARVLPGDHLIAECTYNSRGRDRMTQGGFTTREEMCLVFVYYYPRVDMSMCLSIPTLATVHASVGVTDVWTGRIPAMIKSPAIYANKSLAEHFSKYDWSKNIQLYQEVARTGSFEVLCTRNGQLLLPDGELGHFPSITHEYEEPKGCVPGRHGATSIPSEGETDSSQEKEEKKKKDKHKHQRKHHKRKEQQSNMTTTTAVAASSSSVAPPHLPGGGSTRRTTTTQGQTDATLSTASREGALPPFWLLSLSMVLMT